MKISVGSSIFTASLSDSLLFASPHKVAFLNFNLIWHLKIIDLLSFIFARKLDYQTHKRAKTVFNFFNFFILTR